MEDNGEPDTKRLKETVEKLSSTVKTLQNEVDSIKNNLQLSSEVVHKIVGNGDSESTYEVFGKFVKNSLTNMSKDDADKAVLEIVDVIYKYRNK